MRVVFIFIMAVLVFYVSNARCDEDPKPATVYLTNSDFVSGTNIKLDGNKMLIDVPYAGTLELERNRVIGISFEEGRMRDIISAVVENDSVFTLRGEILSGEITQMDVEGIRLTPSFAPETTSTISYNRASYCVLKKPSKTEEDLSDLVRIVFLNGDVLTGNLAGFADGKFSFQPLRGKDFAYSADQYQCIHSIKNSKQFIEGGLASALIELFKKAGDARSYGSNMFPMLIRAFIASGDKDGARYLFERVQEFQIQPYLYQQIGEEFARANMDDMAVKAFKMLMDSGQRYYYVYDRMLSSYKKLGQKAEAAALCEEWLKNKEALANYGKNPLDIRFEAADLYIELKDFVKATEHLQEIMSDASAKAHQRTSARDKLIGIYKERGDLEKLIERYEQELAANEKTVGDGMVILISRYILEGRLTKAKVELERLRKTGLNEYITQAEKIISDYENPGGEARN